MAKLTRVTAKVFGETASTSNTPVEIGQFGSAKAGTYNATGDVATIQSLSAWSNGWIDSVTPTQQFPPLPEMTGVHKVLSYQNAYLLQQGIPEWDSATTYYENNFCAKTGKIYISKSDNNTNNDPESDTINWEEFSSGSARNIGEIVASTIPLTDAGLHLLDGSLLSGSGSYGAFVDYIAGLYGDGSDIPSYFAQDTSMRNITIVGSPTNNDGVFSNFSTSNRLVINQPFNTGNNTFEAIVKVTTGNDVSTTQYINSQAGIATGAFEIRLFNGKFSLLISYNGEGASSPNGETGAGTYTVLTNTTYWLKVKFTGSAYTLDYSLDGESYTNDVTINSSTTIVQGRNIFFGSDYTGSSYSDPFLGSIDLNETSIYINDTLWWQANQTAEEVWQTTVAQYGACGKFVYDSVNNTVRLPKITGFVEGTTDLTALGDLIQAGLPNIYGTLYASAFSENGTSGAFGSTGTISNITLSTSGGSRIHNDYFDASQYNPIYGNSNTVQPQTIKVLYYIVIATSTKTQIEVDIDEIATDLNGKADVDLTNVNNSGMSKAAGWPMPSDAYDNLTLGASGTRYTAPANGWVQITQKITGSHFMTMATVYTEKDGICMGTQYTGEATENLYIPVQKNETFKVSYSGTLASSSNNRFVFIYAKGSESEAS